MAVDAPQTIAALTGRIGAFRRQRAGGIRSRHVWRQGSILARIILSKYTLPLPRASPRRAGVGEFHVTQGRARILRWGACAAHEFRRNTSRRCLVRAASNRQGLVWGDNGRAGSRASRPTPRDDLRPPESFRDQPAQPSLGSNSRGACALSSSTPRQANLWMLGSHCPPPAGRLVRLHRRHTAHGTCTRAPEWGGEKSANRAWRGLSGTRGRPEHRCAELHSQPGVAGGQRRQPGWRRPSRRFPREARALAAGAAPAAASAHSLQAECDLRAGSAGLLAHPGKECHHHDGPHTKEVAVSMGFLPGRCTLAHGTAQTLDDELSSYTPAFRRPCRRQFHHIRCGRAAARSARSGASRAPSRKQLAQRPGVRHQVDGRKHMKETAMAQPGDPPNPRPGNSTIHANDGRTLLKAHRGELDQRVPAVQQEYVSQTHTRRPAAENP